MAGPQKPLQQGGWAPLSAELISLVYGGIGAAVAAAVVAAGVRLKCWRML